MRLRLVEQFVPQVDLVETLFGCGWSAVGAFVGLLLRFVGLHGHDDNLDVLVVLVVTVEATLDRFRVLFVFGCVIVVSLAVNAVHFVQHNPGQWLDGRDGGVQR